MEENRRKFLNLLFDKNERIFVSDSKFAYHSVDLSTLDSKETTLVSPNANVPVRKIDNRELILIGINPAKHGFRNDENVEKYRTFLWEIDTGTIGQQLEYVKNIMIPISCSVFSGNKSVHFATVLSSPIKSEKIYRFFYQWGLNIGTLFDRNCSNPSRSIRLPDAIRPETQRQQQLLNLSNRIELQDFVNWLKKHPEARPKEHEKRQVSGTADFSKLKGWVKRRLVNGWDLTKGRNAQLFSITCEFFLSGYSEDDTIEILLEYFPPEKDLKQKEIITTIKSAFKYCYNRK
jgi:hypothetical protein